MRPVQDGLIRRAIKRLARAVMTVELGLRRGLLGRGAQRYRVSGSCNGCGRCCEAPSIALGYWTWKLASLRVPFLWWHRVVNGFDFVRTELGARVAVFRCTHFDVQTKRCDSYASRPLMCRDYPTQHTYDAVPQLFDECSLRLVDKRAAVLLRALEAQGLPPERLDELKRKLFLVDADHAKAPAGP